MEIITKEVKRMVEKEKIVKKEVEVINEETGEVSQEMQDVPVVEHKEITEQKKFIRKTFHEDTPLDEAIQNLSNRKEQLENELAEISTKLDSAIQEELKEQLPIIKK
jgi:membrane peptidoglycan carboxypeptidase